MKKMIAIVLSLCMVLAMMTVAASATTGSTTTGDSTSGGSVTDPVPGTGTTTPGAGTGDSTPGTGTTTPGAGPGTTTPGTGTTTPGGGATGGSPVTPPAGGNVGGGSSSDITTPETPAANPFSDVSDTAYYYDAVQWLIAQGITEGKTASTFEPNSGCTRAQMVTFLWRAAGCPEPTSSANPFADISSDAYYAKAVLWAVEKGITLGSTATTFDPTATCTRGQMAAFLYRHAGSPAVSGDHGFNDVAASNYFDSAVVWLLANKITNGTTDTTYSPSNTCTRGQMAAFLYRYLAD